MTGPTALTISMTNSGLPYLRPLPRSNVSRISSFPGASPSRAPLDGALILANTPGEEGRRGKERRGGLGQGGCRRCAGWPQREDGRKGTRMEASASHYVVF